MYTRIDEFEFRLIVTVTRRTFSIITNSDSPTPDSAREADPIAMLEIEGGAE